MTLTQEQTERLDSLSQLRQTFEAEKEARAARAMESYLRTQEHLAKAKQYTAESLVFTGAQTYVNPNDYLPNMFRRDRQLIYGGHIAGIGDRYRGRDLPFIYTLQDASQARGMARLVTKTTCPGVGVEQNLKGYICKDGFTFQAGDKKNSEAPAALVAAVQDVIDDMLDANDFTGDLDKEILWRTIRDGECYNVLYPQKDGITIIRQLEPEQNPEPPNNPFTPEELFTRFGIETAEDCDWSLGVHTPAWDVQRPYGYYVQWDPTDAGDYIPAEHCVHIKWGVERNVKRGLTAFYPSWQWLLQQQDLLVNTGEGAKRLAAIAYIVQYANATASEYQAMRDASLGTYDVTVDLPGGGSKTYTRTLDNPGDVLNVPEGQEFVSGPTGHERGNAFLQIAQGILRQVAVQFCMSEGMISGDDSNNNFASSVVAGSRFHTFCTMMQGWLGGKFTKMAWRAVQFAYDAGRFRQWGFEPGRRTFRQLRRIIEINVTGPDVAIETAADKQAIATYRQILNQSGVLSKKTWMQHEDLDAEREQKQIEEEGGPAGEQQGGAPGAPGAPPAPGGGDGGEPEPPSPPAGPPPAKAAQLDAERPATESSADRPEDCGCAAEDTAAVPTQTPRRPTVAVDLDGTLTLPDGTPKPDALAAMQSLANCGFCLIINTVRGNRQEVATWLSRYGIPYDYINENPFQPPDTSGKIMADVYLDDRAVSGEGPLSLVVPQVIAQATQSASEPHQGGPPPLNTQPAFGQPIAESSRISPDIVDLSANTLMAESGMVQVLEADGSAVWEGQAADLGETLDVALELYGPAAVEGLQVSRCFDGKGGVAEAAVPFAMEKEGDKWITLRSGARVQIDGEGTITAGFGKGENIRAMGRREAKDNKPKRERVATPEEKVAGLFSESEKKLPKQAQQPLKTRDEVYGNATKVKDRYDKVLNQGQGVDSAIGAKVVQAQDAMSAMDEPGPVVILAPLKGEARAAEKVETKYGGDWSQLQDVVRGTVAVDTVDDLPKVTEALREKMESQGFKLAAAPDDKMSNPTPAGYRDVALMMVSPEGMVCELQVNVKSMIKAKQGPGHKMYEEARGIEAKAKLEGRNMTPAEQKQMQDLNGKMTKLYADAWKQAVGGK